MKTQTQAATWQEHSPNFQAMALRTDHHQPVEHPDGYGKNIGECGDSVEMFLSVRRGRVEQVNFVVHGCLNTNACANTVALLAEGLQVSAAWKISPDAVAAYLETLGPDHYHCAELAVGAFYRALADAGEMGRHPWKKSYR